MSYLFISYIIIENIFLKPLTLVVLKYRKTPKIGILEVILTSNLKLGVLV